MNFVKIDFFLSFLLCGRGSVFAIYLLKLWHKFCTYLYRYLMFLFPQYRLYDPLFDVTVMKFDFCVFFVPRQIFLRFFRNDFDLLTIVKFGANIHLEVKNFL